MLLGDAGRPAKTRFRDKISPGGGKKCLDRANFLTGMRNWDPYTGRFVKRVSLGQIFLIISLGEVRLG